VGGVSSDPSLFRVRKPHTNSPAKNNSESATNKNYPKPPYLGGIEFTIMDRQTILVTGTPCVRKTTVAKRLATDLDALYINLTELAKKENLCLGRDKKRKTIIINETKMRKKLGEIISTTGKQAVVIDGHYASAVTPKTVVTKVFVLRRNPVELKQLMEKRGFKEQKLWENLASEILDVCLVEALRAYKKEKVCELNITGQTIETVVKDVLAILQGRKNCCVGQIDWLGMLEEKGILEGYLRT
jgi:adenylate kinase